MALNPKHRRFFEAFHLSGNGTAAYAEVYGTKDPRVAEAAASRLLSTVKAKEYLKILESEAREDFKVTRAEMLRGFKEIFDAKGIEETRDRISAGKEICRIEGHYSKQEVEVSAGDSFAEVLKAITGTKEK